MSKIDLNNLALKLSEAILMHQGEISINDIKALPFLDDPQHARLIVDFLKTKFKADVSIKQNITDFEECLVLKK